MKALIDADSILFYSLPKVNGERATYEECISRMDEKVQDVLSQCNATEYVLVLTGKGCFRYQDWKHSSPYKKRRADRRPHPFICAFKEHMIQEMGAIMVDKLEADDVVSILKTQYGDDAIVASPDKDVLKQTVGRHFDYFKNKFVETSAEEADRFLFMQLLMGDSTDGISGIEGVGPKTAEKILDNKPDDVTYESCVLEAYIEKYGYQEGIGRFYENFTMVYMLKDNDDVLRELGKDFPEIEFQSVTKDEEEINVDDLI